jgi:hypothetical protein
MNNFRLLFEYSNIFLTNKLPILAQNFKKSKLGRNNRMSCFRVDLQSKEWILVNGMSSFGDLGRFFETA